MMKKDSGGYVLLIVLGLLVLVTSIVSGTFSSVSRHQRETSREYARIRTEWAARSLYDSAIYEFQRYLVTTGHRPETSVELNGIIAAAKIPVQADYANMTLNLNINQTTSPDPSKFYFNIVAKVTDTITGLRAGTSLPSEQKGYVYTSTGSLLDFGLFYDGDLEISPGENMEIQGPIFTNGNIYLMSGIGKSLTLKEPDNTPENPVQSTSDYLLRTAGNIFFYFKPVVARNYLLDQSDTYRNGTASYYSDDKYYHGSEASWSSLKEIDAEDGKRLVGYPKLYFFKNQILGADWTVKPADHNIFFKSRGGASERMKFPQFNYWAGDTWEYFSGVTSYTSHYFNKDSYPAADNMSISPAFDLDNRIFYDNLSLVDAGDNRYGFPEGEDSVTASSAVNPYWESYRNGAINNGVLGSTTAPFKVDENLSRQVVSLAQGSENNHDIIEPVSQGGNSEQKLVSKADIVIQCGNTDCTQSQIKYRIMEGNALSPFISPYAVSKEEDPNSRLFYMRPMRNLRLARLASQGQDNNHNPQNRYENAYYQSLVINMTHLSNVLDECKKWNDNDENTSSSVVSAEDSLCKINLSDGLIIYAEIKSFKVAAPGTGGEGAVNLEEGSLSDVSTGLSILPASATSSWPIRQVFLENGERLIRDGVTVVTNGWMWTRGNFNVWEYLSETGSATRCVFPESAESTEWKSCQTPAAALFSDSFGMVASNGAELDKLIDGQATAGRVPYDPGDELESNVMINATVITGYLPSSLERAYPDCVGLASPEDMPKCGGGWGPGTDYIGAPCPAGLNSDGDPVDRNNCNYYFKKQTGVYYFRRNALLRDWLTIIKHEISEYEAVRARFKYTLSDLTTVLDALRFPDHPNWFSNSVINNMTIPQQLAEIQTDINAMQAHMAGNVDFDPNVPSTYAILDGLRNKYGRFNFQMPAFEGYLVDPPNVGAVPGALYGGLGNDSTGAHKDPNVGDLSAYAYIANKLTPPAHTFLGHPVYYPGVPGSVGDMGGYYSTPNYGSSWIVFDPKLAGIVNEDAKKQQKYQNQVKLLWCGSSNPPADFNAILATCTEAEKRNQIYWRMFSFDFVHFPHHWTGIPFYAATSYGLGVGQQAGDSSSKAVTGFPSDPVNSSPLESDLQPIGAPQMSGSGYQNIRIQFFYQANMIGTSSGSGKWILHPGVGETQPPWQEYVPDPTATARFYNLRDVPRGGGAEGFLRPYYYNAAKPDASWNRLGFAHGRQYPIYDVRYSGGWENLINFQEYWAWSKNCVNDPEQGVICGNYSDLMYFRGSQAAPWKSEEMLRQRDEKGRNYDVADSSKPAGERRPPRAFWRTDYYSASQRYYDYDERLSIGILHRPPGMLNLVSLKRAKRLPEAV